MNYKSLIPLLIIISFTTRSVAQLVPSVEENIPYLVTFSKEADKAWGDDDFVQVFFISIPTDRKDPFYVRIYDPEISGKLDENKKGFNSKTKYSVYGGKGNYTHPDAIKTNPEGEYKSGILLKTKTFGSETDYDERWYTLGPFNPSEGELVPEMGGMIFKLMIEGLDGDDGNLYQFYLSSKQDENVKLEGVNAFTYEYTFRSYNQDMSVSHIYPFITKDVVAVKINSFDFDDEGTIRIVSKAKKGEVVKGSQNNNWVTSEHKIDPAEINTSLDVQFIKVKSKTDNNMAVYITNQYNKAVPFFASPIGGIPKYSYKIISNKK